MLSRFVEVLVRRLLVDNGAGELTGLAADALLPLILAHPQAFQHTGKSSAYHMCVHVIRLQSV